MPNIRIKKYRQRIRHSGLHSASQLIVPLLSFVVSVLVIRLQSVELWADFVAVYIIVNFAMHIVQWGNKDYLLKEFSRNPGQASSLWWSALSSRLPLVIPFLFLPVILDFSLLYVFLMGVWVIVLSMYRSFDVLILYFRKFTRPIVLEIAEKVLMAGIIITHKAALTIDFLMILFVAGGLLKLIMMGYWFRDTLAAGVKLSVNFAYLGKALPFFLLGLAGMLQSRIDLYCVFYFLPRQSLAHYQIFINLLLYLYSMPYLILAPYIKTIYRLSDPSIHKLTRRIGLAGMAFSMFAIAVIYAITTYIYQFSLQNEMFIIGYLFALPMFFYMVPVYRLFKLGRQHAVVVVTFTAAGINLIGNVLIIPVMGIMGALIATTISQYFNLIVYLLLNRQPNLSLALICQFIKKRLKINFNTNR